jgi:NAD(P)-dependent dehydrogenase (short-subunit alcohol dehydrogenase family)
LVVGGTSGIGRGIAQYALTHGAKVTIAGRTFRDAPHPSLTFIKADFNLLSASKAFAAALPASSYDAIFITSGMVPGSKRVETAEGVEQDMAVSALSRVVLLEEMAPKLKADARVFVWGFPGTAGLMKKAPIEDFNSEVAYSGAFEAAHMRTVVVNEALVQHYAVKGMHIYGLNPGLIATDIRSSLHGGMGSCCGSCLEGCIGLFNPSVEQYTATLLPILLSDTPAPKGTSFGQSGKPILPTPELTDPAVVHKWMGAANALIAAKASGVSSGQDKGEGGRLPRTLVLRD